MEVKFNEAPKKTASMRSVCNDLRLDHLWIVYPGKESYPVAKNISVYSLSDIDQIPEQALKRNPS